MATLSRLSPLNIEDVLVRAELYREIRGAQAEDYADWREYEVQPADRLMPELIALKVWGLDTLKWVVCVAAGLDNMREPLEVGTILKLPQTSWLRERIKFYMAFEGV